MKRIYNMENFGLDSFIEKYNIPLNEQQKKAVKQIDGAVLLLAVPGSGKTTVLISRLGYMIYEKGINPHSILTMTYTNAAADDMKNRFITFFGEADTQKLTFSTINSVCCRIVNHYVKSEGRTKQFDLISESASTAAIRRIFNEETEQYATDADIKNIKTKISYVKNMMLDSTEIKELNESNLPFSDIYPKYCNYLMQNKLMDYDDQLIFAYRLLKNPKYAKIREYFMNIYKYICVDEAQDTSKIQHCIIRLLSNGNIFMVGDEDQSIYGFRAAYPQALLEFEDRYENSHVFFLESNFRSDAEIVQAADALIKNNTARKEKTMIAQRQHRYPVKEITLSTDAAQYSYLIKTAKSCHEQTAILYRENESILPLADMLDRENIPFNIRSSDLLFFSTKAVITVRSILQFALHPADYSLFARFYLSMGIAIKTQIVAQAIEKAYDTNTDIIDILLSGNYSFKASSQLRKLKTGLKHIAQQNPYDAVYSLMSLGYTVKKNTPEYRKIHTLLKIAKHEQTVTGFLDRLDYLEKLLKNKKFDSDCNLIFSTIHSSKGLEYKNVYIMDAYEGVLPNFDSLDDDELIEEDRRLFYVAMTRAKDRLFVLSYLDKDCYFQNELFRITKSGCASTEIYEKAMSGIPDKWLPVAGECIFHKYFGSGSIVDFDKGSNTIDVLFDSGELKKLSIPLLIKNGCLNICDD